MSEEETQATNPSDDAQPSSASPGPATSTATTPARPHRHDDLGELEEEMVSVNLREQYTIPRDGHKQPHKGPKKLNIPLSDAKAHMAKLQEHEKIRDRWKAIQAEKEHRRAERNLAADVNKPAAKV